MITGVLAVTTLMASVPPVDRDALTHHLAVPKLYLKHGGIYELPYLEFSYYPMNLDILYLIPLYFGNDIVPKYIHFAFALMSAGLIFQYLKRRLSIPFALLGALFFLSIPVIVRLSGTVYVDLGLIFFLFASLLAMIKWIEAGFKVKYLVLSAVLCGLALGAKYNGLIGLFLLALFIPFTYARRRQSDKKNGIKAVGYAAMFVFVALIVFSPWMIRNTIWTGNPIHPLYGSFFRDPGQKAGIAESRNNPFQAQDLIYCPMDAMESDSGQISACMTVPDSVLSRMNQFQVRKHVYGESGLEILAVPIRVFFQGKDDDPKYFDGRASPFLLLLPILAFFGLKSDSLQVKTEKLIFIFFSVLFLLFVYAKSDMRIRYFAPILPPLVILAMFGLNNLKTILTGPGIRISEKFTKFVIVAIIFVMLGINALYMADLFDRIRPFDYLSGRLSRDEYIQKYRPEYAAFQYANQHLRENDRILAIYVGNRGYYSDIDIVFSITALQRLAGAAATPETISAQLRNESVTHLLINYELFNLYVDDYSLHEKKMLKEFFEHHVLHLFSRAGYGLFQVIQDLAAENDFQAERDENE